MSRFLGIVQNENMKIYRRLRTWIMLAIMILFFGFITFMMYKFDAPVMPMQPGPLDIMMLAASFLVFVGIFSIIVAGDIVSSEFGWGTIKLLLIRPISRSKVILAKYIAVLIFILFFLLTLFIFSYLFGLVFFNGGDSTLTLKDVLIEYAYNLPDLIMGFTIAFMISTIFRSSALSIGLGIFLMTVGAGLIVGLLSRYEWAKYILFFNTNLKQYRNDSPMIEGMTMGFSITMLIIYYVVFMALSFWIFNKRDVTN